MWLLLNDTFLSIVHKDCKDDELLVRARRPGDIERVFGEKAKKTTNTDYRYRAVVKRADVERKMALEINAISYDNFKELREGHGIARRLPQGMADHDGATEMTRRGPMLRSGFRDLLNKSLKARPCVGVKFNFLGSI